ncbi:hypothetical protein N411_01160 [Helicobacter pylori FD535]|nr:hypothetical protein N411_01160 [Helicobacter pylori FD535]
MIKFRYKKWGSMIDREVKMQFPKYLKDSKKTAVRMTSQVFYELLKGPLLATFSVKIPFKRLSCGRKTIINKILLGLNLLIFLN